MKALALALAFAYGSLHAQTAAAGVPAPAEYALQLQVLGSRVDLCAFVREPVSCLKLDVVLNGEHLLLEDTNTSAPIAPGTYPAKLEEPKSKHSLVYLDARVYQIWFPDGRHDRLTVAANGTLAGSSGRTGR